MEENKSTVHTAQTSGSLIHSPIYLLGNANVDSGQTGFCNIFEAAAIAVTPKCGPAGDIFLQTDSNGRDVADRILIEAEHAISEWINAVSFLLAMSFSVDIPDSQRNGVVWAITGMSELLRSLQHVRGNLVIPAMSDDAVQHAIALAKDLAPNNFPQ